MARRLALVGGPETLLGLERALGPLGIRVDRIPALTYVPTPPSRVRAAMARFGPYEVLLLTSKEAVHAVSAAGALARSAGGRGPIRVVAGGPATAAALTRAGVPVRWSARKGLGREAARALDRSRPTRVVYLRSDRAGPGLARALRRRGHEVLDLVAYRVLPVRTVSDRRIDRLTAADDVLVTSPSALAAIRIVLGPDRFARFRRREGLIVLGERSARAARGHGFRRVRVVRGSGERAIARLLAGGGAHAG